MLCDGFRENLSEFKEEIKFRVFLQEKLFI